MRVVLPGLHANISSESACIDGIGKALYRSSPTTQPALVIDVDGETTVTAIELPGDRARRRRAQRRDRGTKSKLMMEMSGLLCACMATVRC